MDLPTCPACKQSVLDDDAVECPFCGAPMKGGAAPARPKSPSASATKTSPVKPAPSKSGSGAVAAVKTSPAAGRETSSEERSAETAEDDPFGIDKTATANAIPVSRQQGPGKTLEVTCPMCETKGFVSPKAAGKQVKCCNPQCMVPIFAAPAAEKKGPVVAPKAPKKRLPWAYILGGLAVAGAVAAIVFLKNQKGAMEFAPIDPSQFTKTAPQNIEPDGVGNGKKAGPGVDGADGKANKTDGQQTAVNVRDKVIRESLARLGEMFRDVPAIRKPLWRRLATTAYIHAGEMKQAREQLGLLERPGAQSPYEGVLPVAALAWKASATPDEFAKAVAELQPLASKLPIRGQYQSEAAIAAAALYVVSGKAPAARQLLAEHRSKPAVEQLAAAMQVVSHDGSFNLDATLSGRTVGDWQAPLETAVTLILADRGRWDAAYDWATTAADPVTKTEGTIVWAESFARRAVPAGDTAGFERALKAAEGLSTDGKARLLSRLAEVKLSAGDRPGAEELVTQAKAELDTITRPVTIKVTSAKAVHDLKLPEALPLRQAALASAEIAGAQAHLGLADAAWQSILVSLKFLHGIGPSQSSIEDRARQTPDKIRAELKTAMALKNADQTSRAYNQYKEKFADMYAATAVRFQSEPVILEAAASFGLLDQVWDHLQAVDRKTDIHEREPFLSTGVPFAVAARYRAAGNEKRREEVFKAVNDRVNPADPEVVRWVANFLVDTGEIADCIQRLNDAMTPDGVLHEWTLRLACRLVNAGKISDALALVHGITDATLHEDGLFLISALAARTGHAEEFRTAAAALKLGVMDEAAVCSGLVVGLTAQPAEK